MAVSSDLYEAWILFRSAVLTVCDTDAWPGNRKQATTEAEWYLGRIRAIVEGIKPETLPRLHPVYVHQLQAFIQSWEGEPARIRKGSWDGREQLHRNFLDLQADEVQNAIRHIQEAEQINVAGDRALTPHIEPEPFLGIILGDRKASRLLDGVTLGPVDFGTKSRPWELLTMLVEGGAAGVSCGDVQDKFNGKQYVHKSTLLALVRQLRLNVHTDGGTWKLVHLP
jgi:hypothetical protein